jgi:hypothetical protein
MARVARRTVGTPQQGSLICDGMAPMFEAPAEHEMGDVFALWVDRIADLNLAIAEHNARAD